MVSLRLLEYGSPWVKTTEGQAGNLGPTDRQAGFWQATDGQIRLDYRQGQANYPLLSWDRQTEAAAS